MSPLETAKESLRNLRAGLRPDVECAPWVIGRIDKIIAALDAAPEAPNEKPPPPGMLHAPTAATTVPQFKFDALVEDMKREQAEVKRLNAIPRHQRMAERGDYWIWMGDAEDHLESMSDGMLVLIRADQLRAISGMTLSRRAFLDTMFSIDSSTMTFGDARALLRAVGVTVTP